MGEVKVSVIIPVYQVENYLERAVDSVLNQTLKEMEIILVDDGSTDASGSICDRYAMEYPSIIQVIHKENEGLGLARNTGLDAAVGTYVAFLDSDDTVEPQMYERMYLKAEEGSYDMVMCDVKILFIEEGRSEVISSYHTEQVEVSDYIANGNNITYSVNKLFRRTIWEENRYEKMLFEDIALIPSLVTRYTNIGYVREAYYHYYRRANTLSTTKIGRMVEVTDAYRKFLDRCNSSYREESVYCAAKQILWNMTNSRVLFQADFIDLSKSYESDFLLNSYIAKDKKTRAILDFLKKEVIPENIFCPCFGRPVPSEYKKELETDFPKAKLLILEENSLSEEELPEQLQRAWEEGKRSYVEEYMGLRALYEKGGIVLMPYMRANLNLKKMRLNRIFFGFEDPEEMTSGCFGAVKRHYVIQALLSSYQGDHIFNKTYAPLAERIRDLLLIHFQLKVNGKTQLLKKEIQIYLPSILAYDMKDGENCCKHEADGVPEGYELVSDPVLKFWSDRLMENWNLYKKARAGQGNKGTVPLESGDGNRTHEITEWEIQERIRQVTDQYENSTCWKLTRPLRVLGNLFRNRKEAHLQKKGEQI